MLFVKLHQLTNQLETAFSIVMDCFSGEITLLRESPPSTAIATSSYLHQVNFRLWNQCTSQARCKLRGRSEQYEGADGRIIFDLKVLPLWARLCAPRAAFGQIAPVGGVNFLSYPPLAHTQSRTHFRSGCIMDRVN